MDKSPDFVAGCDTMIRVRDLLAKVAGLDTTVLLEGESGTGKEVAAQFLHEQHPIRHKGPFVCVHCGAIPENLIESELFGHVRGAFTGADRDRVGRFEQADGGTLLLDEISTMSADVQVRLLRVLQERRVTPLGARNPKPVNVRVVAATNRRLSAMVADGRLREDLYYRLATFPVRLPPLRDRLDDIPALIEVLGARVRRRLGLEGRLRLGAAALRAMVAHNWPGNVRELENAIEYATIQSLGRDQAGLDDLPPEIAGNTDLADDPVARPIVTEKGLSFRTVVTRVERDLILQSLELAGGNKAKAAELLELKRTTFLEKLRRLELDAQVERSSAESASGVVA